MFNFKFILTSVFSVAIVVGVAVFAMSKGPGSSGEIRANLKVWGTMTPEAFNTALQSSSLANSRNIHVVYEKKDASTFDANFVEAIASGSGPDVVILREDSIYKQRNKFFIIPYKNYTERTFKDKFVEEAEIFLTSEGVLAVPFTIDPMVLFWNRSLFTNALISRPPVYWDDVYPIIEKITKKDSNANILQSAIALGEWSNITNSKEVVSMLLLQAGSTITSKSGDKISATLTAFNKEVEPAQYAINFYTQFSNPTGVNYTWNRSLPNSQNFFLSGNLAMYIGFASELFSIQQKNSNLNFDVTYIPQIRNGGKTTFAHMNAFAIVKQSQQVTASYMLINAMTEASALKALETITNLPPVRRDLLADAPTDAYRSVFYNSALISKSWMDPDPVITRNIFRDMIESITSGKSRVRESIDRAQRELSALLP